MVIPRPRGIIIDLALLFFPPLFDREILLYVLETEGYEVVCRSFLGRGTTRSVLRESLLLHYFDDIYFNDRAAPSDFYEITGPEDDLFYLITHLTALYSRGRPLTHSLSLHGGAHSAEGTDYAR